MTHPAFHDLCRRLCRELRTELSPVAPTPQGHETLSLVIDGIPATIAHAPSHAPGRLLILVEMGSLPPERELELQLDALDTNLRQQGANAVSIGRSPDTGELVLQMSCPIEQPDALAVLRHVMTLAQAARAWRSSAVSAAPSNVADMLSTLQAHGEFFGHAHDFESLCAGLCEALGIDPQALTNSSEGTTALEVTLHGVRTILSHGAHTGPDHVQLLVTFGALPSGREAQAARRLLELNLQVLAQGYAFARHPWSGDVLLRQTISLRDTRVVDLLQRLHEVADGVQDWQEHHFLTSDDAPQVAVH